MPTWRASTPKCSVLKGDGLAQPNPRPMFPNPPGPLRVEPHSPGLRDRIWWGAGTRATAEWTAEQGLNLMSSTLLSEDTGVLLTVPNQLGVAFNAHVIESVLTHLAPELGWR
jgi:alkanesulfonate monooxygenase SsuD/methylene tetrahydromethanopterin reductase-like flavin-dependent oxidoreductase (luciferase family)